jgi:hypothetical protein
VTSEIFVAKSVSGTKGDIEPIVSLIAIENGECRVGGTVIGRKNGAVDTKSAVSRIHGTARGPSVMKAAANCAFPRGSGRAYMTC